MPWSYVFAALGGALLPQIGSAVRARWSHVLDEPADVQTAFALEGVLDEAVFILGPIANALSGVFSGAGGIFANVLHAGGMVGSAGPSRMVPAMAFAAAPRMHGGGMAGLRHDEVPAILQRGERVLSRREAQSYGAGGGVNVTIMARDAESFRQSRTQVATDIARAVSLGRRGM